jgi:hypothetical protein
MPSQFAVAVEGAALVSVVLQRITAKHTAWQRVSVWLLQRDVLALLKSCLQRAEGMLSQYRTRGRDEGDGAAGVAVAVTGASAGDEVSDREGGMDDGNGGELEMFVMNAKAVLLAWQSNTRTKGVGARKA